MKKPGEAVRVKDLYDLTRIIRAKPEEVEATIVAIARFWQGIGLFPLSFPLL